jgi:hypothetical protein
MVDPVDKLRAAAARLKRECDELVWKIEALPRPDVGSRGGDAPLTVEQTLLIAQRAVNLYIMRNPRPQKLLTFF